MTREEYNLRIVSFGNYPRRPHYISFMSGIVYLHCVKCNSWKPVDNFSKDNHAKDKKFFVSRPECKVSQKEIQKRYLKNNPKKANEFSSRRLQKSLFKRLLKSD